MADGVEAQKGRNSTVRWSFQRFLTSNLLFALALLLALIIGWHVQSIVNQAKGAHTVQVVVLKGDRSLAPYQLIQASDVELTNMPRHAVQSDSLYSLKDAVGKRTDTKILPSTILRKGHLLQSDSVMNTLSGQGNKLVAVTVTLDPEQNQLAQVGDTVTLQGLIRKGSDSTLFSLRRIPVIDKQEQVLTVAVTEEQADGLNHVMLNGGKIRISLVQP